MFNDFQSQVLIGTVLGGSSLVKPPKGINYYLSMRSQNEMWLKYKMSEMPKYFKDMKIHKYGNTLRCNSCCCESLTEFYHWIYKDGKRNPSMDLFDVLMDTGIAIWYLDSGGKTGRNKKNAYLNTTKFGEKNSKIALQYFNEIEIPCNINHDGKRTKLLFTVSGTVILLKTIAHRFPTFMHDRI